MTRSQQRAVDGRGAERNVSGRRARSHRGRHPPTGCRLRRCGSLPLLVALVLLHLRLFAAEAPHVASYWRMYKAADGLTESLTTAITLSPRGNLWVKHGEVDAVSFLDGYTISHIAAPGERTARVYESRAGKIWSTYPLGLLEFVNDAWLHRPIDELRLRAEAGPLRAAHQAPLLPAEQDRVLLLLPDRFAEYRSLSGQVRVLRWARETRLERFLDLLPATDGGVWISGARGLAKIPGPLRQVSTGSVWAEHVLPANIAVQDLQRPFEDDDGGVTAIAEATPSGRRVLAHFDGANWLTRELPGESLRYAWRDASPGRFWGLTFNALVRFEAGRDEVERIAATPNQYFDVAVQPRGVFWLATLEGLIPCTLR